MLRARGAVPLLARKARLAEGEPRCGVTARDGRAVTRNLSKRLLPFGRRRLSRFLRGDAVPRTPGWAVPAPGSAGSAHTRLAIGLCAFGHAARAWSRAVA